MNEEPLPMKKLLGAMGQRLGLSDPAGTGMVWSRWNDLVGPGIATHCKPSSLREGVLRLRADGPTWATEVGYLAEEIRRKVNEMAGSELVREVKVWVAPPGPGEGAAPTRKSPRPKPDDRSRGGRDGDPVEALGRAREAWARRRSGAGYGPSTEGPKKGEKRW